MPQIIYDNFLMNFEYFIVLLGASDVVSILKLYISTYSLCKSVGNHRKSGPKHLGLYPFLDDPGNREKRAADNQRRLIIIHFASFQN